MSGSIRPNTLRKIAEALNCDPILLSKNYESQEDFIAEAAHNPIGSAPSNHPGAKLKLLRDSRNTSPKEIAEATQITERVLREIEAGEVYPHTNSSERLAKFLNVPYELLAWRRYDAQDVERFLETGDLPKREGLLAKRMREVFAALGYNEREAATKMEIELERLKEILCGEREANYKEIRLFIDRFGVNSSTIFGPEAET